MNIKADKIVFMFVCPGIVGRVIGRVMLLPLCTTTPEKATVSVLHWHDRKDGKATLTPLGLLRTWFEARGARMILLETNGAIDGFVVDRETKDGE